MIYYFSLALIFLAIAVFIGLATAIIADDGKAALFAAVFSILAAAAACYIFQPSLLGMGSQDATGACELVSYESSADGARIVYKDAEGDYRDKRVAASDLTVCEGDPSVSVEERGVFKYGKKYVVALPKSAIATGMWPEDAKEEQPAGAVESSAFCPKCGQKVADASDAYCRSCGAKLADAGAEDGR